MCARFFFLLPSVHFISFTFNALFTLCIADANCYCVSTTDFSVLNDQRCNSFFFLLLLVVDTSRFCLLLCCVIAPWLVGWLLEMDGFSFFLLSLHFQLPIFIGVFAVFESFIFRCLKTSHDCFRSVIRSVSFAIALKKKSNPTGSLRIYRRIDTVHVNGFM